MRLLPTFAIGSAAFFGLLCLHFASGDATRLPIEPLVSAGPLASQGGSSLGSENAGVAPRSPEVTSETELNFVSSEPPEDAELPLWGLSREAISPAPYVPAAEPLSVDSLIDVAATVETTLATPLRNIRIGSRTRWISRAGPRPGNTRKAPFTVSVRVQHTAWIDTSPSLHAYAEITLQRTVRNKTTYQVRVHRGTGEVWVRKGEDWVAAADWLKDFDAYSG